MRIKLFEGFTILNKIKSNISDIFVELTDEFDIEIKCWVKNRSSNNKFESITIDIKRIDNEMFDTSIIEEYDSMLRDYLDDVLTSYKIEYLKNLVGCFSDTSEADRKWFFTETGNSPRFLIKIVGEYEDSKF